MGVIVKKLEAMNGIMFDGFGDNPEDQAKNKMNAWLKLNPNKNKYRVFGYNIDENGDLNNETNNLGYRFILITDYDEVVISPGIFVVTGIEGNFSSDPDGKWIKDGWDKLSQMVKEKNYKIKKPIRWYEEELEPQKDGNLRLDLYLETE